MKTNLTPEDRLAALNLTLPPAPARGGNYVSTKLVGDVLYLSGAVSSGPDGVITGMAGAGRSVEEGYQAARAAALNQLAVLKRELGSLERVAEVLTLNGFVNAAPGFGDAPEVINGASDLLVEVFGEEGRHVRTALGVSAIPRNALVEIQMTVRIKES